MTDRLKHIIIAGLAAMVVILIAAILLGIHNQQLADARADERIKAEASARDARAREDKLRDDKTAKLVADLEDMKRQKATPDNTLAILAALTHKPEVVTIPAPAPVVTDAKAPQMPQGEKLPDSPGLLFKGDALTDLRNFGISCQQCDANLQNERATVKSRDADIAGLKKSLKESEDARKGSKWQRTKEWLIRGAIAVGSYEVGKAGRK